MPFLRLILSLAAGALLMGCGSDTEGVRVCGSASYGGQPIENGSIELYPIDGTSGPATGATISGGRWEIAADKGPRRGGTYVVRITGLKKTGESIVDRDRPGQPAEVLANYIPARYNAASTLKTTIPAKGSDELHFDLPKASAR